MITVEKFIKALQVVKPEGHWSLGLIIIDPKLVDVGVLDLQIKKIVADGSISVEIVVDQIIQELRAGRSVALAIEKILPKEIYDLLKSLAHDNRVYLADGTEQPMVGAGRLVVLAELETVRNIEKVFPDFKFLFGPILTV